MVLEDYRIKQSKLKIKEFEAEYKRTGNPLYLNKIENEHRNIRKLQAKDMERLD